MRHSTLPCFFSLVVCIASVVHGGNAVDLVVGESQFFSADHIEILSVESSGEGFELGATVTVTGVYTLNSTDTGRLCFYTTSLAGAKPTPTPVQASQRMQAKKGKHIFTLSKVIKKEGNPHLTFYHTETGKPFGGVYFGEKSNVLMEKSWSYHAP